MSPVDGVLLVVGCVALLSACGWIWRKAPDLRCRRCFSSDVKIVKLSDVIKSKSGEVAVCGKCGCEFLV
jgi:hypothetical protein